MKAYVSIEGQVAHGDNHAFIFRFFNTSIPAGFPSPAQDYSEEDIDLSKILQPNKDATFIIRIKGNSMQEANMPDNCLAVVDRSVPVHNGAIVVAILDGEFTVKRFVKQGGTVMLHPENPYYKQIVITEEMDFQIWGVVTHVIVDMRK